MYYDKRQTIYTSNISLGDEWPAGLTLRNKITASYIL